MRRVSVPSNSDYAQVYIIFPIKKRPTFQSGVIYLFIS